MKRIRLETKHYQWGLTAFLVVVCCVLVFFAIYRFDVIQKAFALCWKVITPFVYGLIIAYLVCPLYNATVRTAYGVLNKGDRKLKNDMNIAKAIGTVISVLAVIVVIFGLVLMVLPGLVDSILSIAEKAPSTIEKMNKWIDNHMSRLTPEEQNELYDWVASASDSAVSFAKDTLLPHSKALAAGLTQGVMGAARFMLNFVIGIIISVYFLNSKDTFIAQIKKLILAAFKEKTAEEILNGARFTNSTFGGFISGKVIDSLIIGIICFIVMSIFGWEYSLLISCIVGMTNIIPFFGPFIGAVPSVLLLLIANPMHALYFVIFIILLQQFDGNILGPKILGDSTGLDSFWVLFAVLVGGGLFGFVGMVIGIPVFAVIAYYFSRAVNRKLETKGYSVDLNDYKVDPYRTKPKKKKNRIVSAISDRIGKGKAETGKEETASDTEGNDPESEEPAASPDGNEDRSKEPEEYSEGEEK